MARQIGASFGRVAPRQTQGPNAAEYGAPHVSGYGSGLRAALASGRVVHRVAPLAARTGGFRDRIGALVVRAASVRTVVQSRFGYTGILPLAQQPKLAKPQPYTQGTGARP